MAHDPIDFTPGNKQTWHTNQTTIGFLKVLMHVSFDHKTTVTFYAHTIESKLKGRHSLLWKDIN